MAKIGRPTDINKAENRLHSVSLSKKAELIFRKVNLTRNDRRWFSRFVSECVIDAFASEDGVREKLIVYELNSLQKERDKLEKEMQLKAIELQEIRNKINIKYAEKELNNILKREVER